jgi:hypothetical protein
MIGQMGLMGHIKKRSVGRVRQMGRIGQMKKRMVGMGGRVGQSQWLDWGKIKMNRRNNDRIT